jgi:hypothetical protein
MLKFWRILWAGRKTWNSQGWPRIWVNSKDLIGIFWSNCWVNLRILGQPCEFYLECRPIVESPNLSVPIKIKIGIFFCLPFTKFSAFSDRNKTDPWAVNPLEFFFRKLRLGCPFWNGPRTLEISKTSDNKKYPYLDFDRNRPNTGIRPLAEVPSCLKDPPEFGDFWYYSLEITYISGFSDACPHSSRIKSLAYFLPLFVCV